MYLLRKPPYHLKLDASSRYDQVLTGVLPYHGSDESDMITRIRTGKRPSRPTDASQNQWLQDPTWDVITAGWRDQPTRRCELTVMRDIFVAGTSQIPKRQRAKIIPRIASFFQFLQNSESEIQRQVNKMNEVTSFTHILLKLTRLAAS